MMKTFFGHLKFCHANHLTKAMHLTADRSSPTFQMTSEVKSAAMLAPASRR